MMHAWVENVAPKSDKVVESFPELWQPKFYLPC
jgi:hypothetical protein